MNILFVNYGDFTTNSLNHIGGFADTLAAAGHACVVAVPMRKETVTSLPRALFHPASFAEVLERPDCFPDGRSADVIHAWTPREWVREFVVAYQSLRPARLVVHLEDNEDHLLEGYTGKPLAELLALPRDQRDALLTGALCHPLRRSNLLHLADAVTIIEERLAERVPAGPPTHLLRPGLDPLFDSPRPLDLDERRALGLRDEERLVVFTGSTSFANEAEMRALYLAVALLNTEGTPTRLVRTGFTSPQFAASISPQVAAHVLDLGIIEKHRLPALVASADVLVQPGTAGSFNDFRLPSKIPEFLASGRPVVVPATNIGLRLRDGVDALLLRTGTPEEIASACRRVFSDTELAHTLGRNGRAFAREHFDLAKNTARLQAIYAALLAAPSRISWPARGAKVQGDLSLLLDRHLAARADDRSISADLVAQVRELEHEAALRREAVAERENALADLDLTRTHASNLEQLLAQNQAAAEATRAHVANLEATILTLHASIADLRVSEALAAQSEAHAHATREASERRLAENTKILEEARHLARRQLDDARTAHDIALRARDASIEALREEIASLQTALRIREDKIARMQRSFSWQATAPLRAVRRTLTKRVSRPGEESIPAAVAASASTPVSTPPALPASTSALGPAVRFAIDEPRTWSDLECTRFTVRGWLVRSDHVPVSEIRGRIGEATFPARMKRPRADVKAAMSDHPHAGDSGFAVDIAGAKPACTLVLEHRDAAGSWHAFSSIEVSFTEDATDEPHDPYRLWMRHHEDRSPAELRRQRDEVTRWSCQPLVSIVVPVYDAPERWLRRAIESVREQTYPHWELCLADDASPAPHVRAVLEEAAAADPRIKVVFREDNGHISAASNSALALATGDWIALLDHDDELAPDALYRVAAELIQNPDTDLVYSDEDKISEEGVRSTPYFKPDFLPDLLLGQNFICHLAVYRASLVRELGGFRLGYEGSQDWDLALRVVERTSPERIRHIPRVLYHWRTIAGSTALLLSEKSYPVEAARKALTDHLARTAQPAELVPVPGGHWRIKHRLPEPAPLVSLVIPTRNGLRLLRQCVESILAKTTYRTFEILVVDNGSDDPETLAWLREIASEESTSDRPAIRVLRDDRPFNYSALNNAAVAHARGEFVALINNDLEVISPDWLEEMLSQAARPGVGCVGAMLYYPDDTIQHAGVVLGIGGVAGHAFKRFPRGGEGVFNRARLVQNYSAVTAACLVVRKSTYEQVGGLGEKKLAVAFNDVDFCLKVRAAGYRNVWTPFAELYHHESASRGLEDTPEKHVRFRSEIETMLERWGDLLRADPAYNPNLTLEHEDFSIEPRPRAFAALRTSPEAESSRHPFARDESETPSPHS
jgi:glycosyltransferase involved in cell wall biosynthesis